MDKEDLKQYFYESLKPLLTDKEAQEDEEIVNFYIEVCCDIAEMFSKHKHETINK